MEFGALKPLLSSLALPPLLMLLGACLGVVLAVRRKRLGLSVIAMSIAALWLLSCHGTAVWLARNALPQFTPLTVSALKASKAQAIVVLGGGLLPDAPEYDSAQPNGTTFARLRYGLWLHKQTGLPVAFTGGLGWAGRGGAAGAKPASEADVVEAMALQDYGVKLRWLERQSRDTAENARLLADLLKRDGITHIALVTNSWHMPRAALHFAATGMAVLPAPMGYVVSEESSLMEWLPSAQGLQASQRVIRERLGLLVAGRAGG